MLYLCITRSLSKMPSCIRASKIMQDMEEKRNLLKKHFALLFTTLLAHAHQPSVI